MMQTYGLELEIDLPVEFNRYRLFKYYRNDNLTYRLYVEDREFSFSKQWVLSNCQFEIVNDMCELLEFYSSYPNKEFMLWILRNCLITSYITNISVVEEYSRVTKEVLSWLEDFRVVSHDIGKTYESEQWHFTIVGECFNDYNIKDGYLRNFIKDRVYTSKQIQLILKEFNVRELAYIPLFEYRRYYPLEKTIQRINFIKNLR